MHRANREPSGVTAECTRCSRCQPEITLQRVSARAVHPTVSVGVSFGQMTGCMPTA